MSKLFKMLFITTLFLITQIVNTWAQTDKPIPVCKTLIFIFDKDVIAIEGLHFETNSPDQCVVKYWYNVKSADTFMQYDLNKINSELGEDRYKMLCQHFIRQWILGKEYKGFSMNSKYIYSIWCY